MVGSIVGGIIAFLLFAVTAFSLPMLLDRDVDYVTAMVTSYRAVTSNPQPMLHWAWIIAASIIVAMLPLFLGLRRGAAGARTRHLASLSEGDRARRSPPDALTHFRPIEPPDLR